MISIEARLAGLGSAAAKEQERRQTTTCQQSYSRFWHHDNDVLTGRRGQVQDRDLRILRYISQIPQGPLGYRRCRIIQSHRAELEIRIVGIVKNRFPDRPLGTGGINVRLRGGVIAGENS